MRFTLNGRGYDVEPSDVAACVKGLPPQRIYEHAVEVDGVLYPVKQVFAELTGRHASEFTSQRAQDVLRRLGFTDPRQAGRAERLRARLGQPSTWVLEIRAIGGGCHTFELAEDESRSRLNGMLQSHVGSAEITSIKVRNAAAVGGSANLSIAWATVTAASLYELGRGDSYEPQ